MAISRANMSNQINKPPMKKKFKKKAQPMAIGRKSGGPCRGMGKAVKGGNFTVS